MNGAQDISYWTMFAGYAFFAIPFLILAYFKTGLVKDSVIAVVRMTVQLLLVGFYLEYLFKYDNTALNIAWFFAMTLVATFEIIKRSELNIKRFALPVFIGMFISMSFSVLFFTFAMLQLSNIFEARYFIPIAGMLMGNSLKNIIVAMNSYYGCVRKNINSFRWYLANGATRREALAPFMRDAMRKAFNPLISTTAVMGLISLPGMMTGQILGGSSPSVAIKYQIVLMISFFSSAVLSVVLTFLLSDRYVFDEFDNMKEIWR